MYSKSEAEYEQQWAAFERARKPAIIDYIYKVWIQNHKEKFITAWTDKVRHFGHRVTSRAESAH